MGLGGIARDSIVGLNRLVHDDDDDDNIRPPRRTGSWNNGSNKGSGEFLYLEGNNDNNAVAVSASQSSFETSLNDGMASSSSNNSPLMGRNTAAAPTSTPSPRSSAAAAAATAYSKVSATNSRPLESYRPQNSPKESSYQGFQYEGYTDYYSEDYTSYNYNEYGSSNRGENDSIFCCLFPWMKDKDIESEDVSVTPSGLEVEQEQAKQEAVVVSSSPKSVTGVEPSMSASAPEKVAAASPLSPTPSLKEKFPVATSLGSGIMPAPSLQDMEQSEMPSLAKTPKAEPPSKNVNFTSPQSAAEKQPTTPHMLAGGHLDSTSSIGSVLDEKKQEDEDVASIIVEAPEEQEEEEEDSPPPIKSILKVRRCSHMTPSSSNNSISNQNNGKKKGDKKEDNPMSSPKKQHRHLFPTYEPKKLYTDGENGGQAKSINFNPMARVLTIPSRKDIPFHQKAQVWWQKCDYDEFKKTGRIISKAMECGGSEIWLASSNAWGDRASQSTPKTTLDRSTDSDEYNKALAKYVNEEKKGHGAVSGATSGNKWWCKFGHSRRGLEHIASSSEGRARQQSVLLATRMVLEEQKRQRASRTKDPNKLRNVAMQYTSWARDLSLAGGSADAEAVTSNFDPSAASRAHHFAKQLNVNSNSLHTLNQSDAVGGGVAMAITSQILDANTHGTSMARRSQGKSLKPVTVEHENSLSARAKGFMPGGGGNMGFRAVKV
eukprot:CAMPEP_0172304946 /NCGR_PEP_ID=MMETSP1058-20130122/6285_1 /TAXON_ID=83371 /ORGANISM="Detonula confervacea, Strain CCMP 353" /LENGTH=714 /DNA_ID=CAMNT_0013016353 /DNA_START=142 /DNA_END=2286 /DNA_ORIENTATION=+